MSLVPKLNSQLCMYEGWKWTDCIHIRQKPQVVFITSVNDTCVEVQWVNIYLLFFFFVTSEMYTEGVIIHISYYTVPLSFNSFTMLQMSCGWYINQNVKVKWKDYVLFLMVGRGRDPFDITNFRYLWKYLLTCLCISSWKFLVGICTK